MLMPFPMRVALAFALLSTASHDLAPSAARGDSWAAPSEQVARSGNRKFKAVSQPSKNGAAMLTVYAVRPGGEAMLWQTRLSNEHSPVELLVTDDGRHVITLDNWHGLGKGDDALAFYSSRGQVKRYSLTQALGMSQAEVFRSGVSISVSSIHWRSGSISFLDSTGDNAASAWCIWLSWCDRWYAWNAATGDCVRPDPEREAAWQARAREWALAQENVDAGDVETAVKFLGKLAKPEDRPWMERRLAATDFHAFSSSREGDPTVFGASSTVREAADKVLADWAKRSPAEGEPYVYLGVVTADVRLPAAPVKSPDARLFVYLFPESVTPDGATPANAAARVEVQYRYVGENWTRIGQTIPVRFQCLTPGRYWLKAIDDVAEPFARETPPAEAGAGDGQSANRELFDVIAGSTTVASGLNVMKQ